MVRGVCDVVGGGRLCGVRRVLQDERGEGAHWREGIGGPATKQTDGGSEILTIDVMMGIGGASYRLDMVPRGRKSIYVCACTVYGNETNSAAVSCVWEGVVRGSMLDVGCAARCRSVAPSLRWTRVGLASVCLCVFVPLRVRCALHSAAEARRSAAGCLSCRVVLYGVSIV